MSRAEEMEPYMVWLLGLSPDEFENERYTVTREWRKIGMSAADAEYKRASCEIAAHKRAWS